MVKWIIAAILLLPVAEIATFVLVAALIGLGWAFVFTLATTIAGFMVLRRAGRGHLDRFRVAVTESGVTGIEAHTTSFLTVLAGILLFLPGFLTDLAGALLLLGPIRRASAAAFRRTVTRAQQRSARAVIDLAPNEWKQVSDRDTPPRDRPGQDRDKPGQD